MYNVGIGLLKLSKLSGESSWMGKPGVDSFKVTLSLRKGSCQVEESHGRVSTLSCVTASVFNIPGGTR